MPDTLRVATFNIHKGVTHFSALFTLEKQRELLRNLQVDVVFLQEVRDAHVPHSKRFGGWPSAGQTQFLATEGWNQYVYGKNAIYPTGHHGNALLSKFPITKTHNENISVHTSESRGMLHCEIDVPDWEKPLHAICLHLGLFAHWRRQQLTAVASYIEKHVPPNAPLIIAGDFNDWNSRGGKMFAARLHLHEAFERHTGKHAKSFPSWLPVLKLDRIYVRGFEIKHTEVHSGPRFLKLSDHAMLTTTLLRP